MSDTMTPEQRSRCMAAIKGKNTKPEMLVRKFLFSKGLRYRLHTGLPGHPDIVLPKYKTVVFVDGCFWHGHEGCRYFRLPKSNEDFWRTKIETNTARDHRVTTQLRDAGWRVIRIWECSLRDRASLPAVLDRLYLDITSPIHPTNPVIPSIAAEPTAPYGQS